METEKKPKARDDWRGYQRKWYAANKAKVLARKRQRYAVERAHKTERYIRIRNTVNEWYHANKEKWIVYRENYLERQKVLNSQKQPCDTE